MDAMSVAINAIGWTLIHSLWLGALAAAAYALPAARLRNQAPQLAYGWGLVCLLLLVLSLGLLFAHEFDRLKDSADAQAIARAYAARPVESGVLSCAEAAPSAAPSSIARGIDQILPLLVLDTVPKFVQLIKLVQQTVGHGSEAVRAPRQVLEGAEREAALEVIQAALNNRAAALA